MQGRKGEMTFRLKGETVQAVEDWRRAQPTIPSRVEAVRLLIGRGLSTFHQQDNPQGSPHLAPMFSTELPLSTATTLQKTDNLSSIEGSGDNGNSGVRPAVEPKRRAIEREEELAHQALFGRGVADLVEISGLDENIAHDRVVAWVLASSALYVLTLIEAAKNMGLEPGAVAPLISSQIHSYKPITGLPEPPEGA